VGLYIILVDTLTYSQTFDKCVFKYKTIELKSTKNEALKEI